VKNPTINYIISMAIICQ